MYARDPQSGSLAFFPLFSKMQFARRAQEGVWGGNAHALAFWGGADFIAFACPPVPTRESWWSSLKLILDKYINIRYAMYKYAMHISVDNIIITERANGNQQQQ